MSLSIRQLLWSMFCGATHRRRSSLGALNYNDEKRPTLVLSFEDETLSGDRVVMARTETNFSLLFFSFSFRCQNTYDDIFYVNIIVVEKNDFKLFNRVCTCLGRIISASFYQIFVLEFFLRILGI